MPQTSAADSLLQRQYGAVLDNLPAAPVTTPRAAMRPNHGGFGFAVNYDPDPDAGGGAGGDGGAGGGAGDDKNKKETPPGLSADAAKQLQRERDRAKTLNRAVFAALGVNADEIEWEDSSDGARVPKIPGLDTIKTLVDEHRQRADTDADKGKTFAQRKAELLDQHKQQLAATKTQFEKKEKGLLGIIGKLAKSEPLKAALAQEGAIDDPDGKGNYAELVALLAPRLRESIDVDEQGAYSLAVGVMGDDDKPRLDGQGNPLSIQAFVKAWLDVRPHYRRANFRPGSGAGGHGGAGGRQQAAPNAQQAAATAAASLFGRDTTQK